MQRNPLASWITLVFSTLLVSLPPAEAAGQGTPGTPEPTTIDTLTWALAQIGGCADTTERARQAEALMVRLKIRGRPISGDSSVWFFYSGNVSTAAVAGDFNGWRPDTDRLMRIEGTNVFFLEKKFDPASRFEYKIVADTRWMLDPLNSQQAVGGYGPNSEVWMPRYVSPEEITYRPRIPHGTIDTLHIPSALLGRTSTVYVYLPPGRSIAHRVSPAHTGKTAGTPLPVVFVMDGGEYISLARMITILDNCIADKRIPPIGAVFVDPRLDPRNSATSMRGPDYTLNDTFVVALAKDFRDPLAARYGFSTDPRWTGIMGASLGGLVATYAAYRSPDVFGLSAAQSPAYGWREEAILGMLSSSPHTATRFYIDTGTMRDAEASARRMRDALLCRGYTLRYGEYPEGHNWVNWRARIDDILEFFYGAPLRKRTRVP